MVLELGSELISSDIIALYELIKNGFDAGTTTGIEINFNILLRRNAYLTLRNQFAAGGTDLPTLRTATQRAFNAMAPQSLSEQANEILDKVKSLAGFSKVSPSG